MRSICNWEAEPKSKGLDHRSEAGSQNTEDSCSLSAQPKLLNLLHQHISATSVQFELSLTKFNTISSSTFPSDKIVRLTGSLVKVVRNCSLFKQNSRLEKTAKQIGQLRRLLRVNRATSSFRDFLSSPFKKNKTLRDFFDLFFKALMFVCDLMDILAYLMQLQVLKDGPVANLRKYVANLYFFECVIWTLLHAYEFVMNIGIKTPKDSLKKKMTIFKYALDSLTSHNEFSGRQFTLSGQSNSFIGLISSLLGMITVWI